MVWDSISDWRWLGETLRTWDQQTPAWVRQTWVFIDCWIHTEFKVANHSLSKPQVAPLQNGDKNTYLRVVERMKWAHMWTFFPAFEGTVLFLDALVCLLLQRDLAWGLGLLLTPGPASGLENAKWTPQVAQGPGDLLPDLARGEAQSLLQCLSLRPYTFHNSGSHGWSRLLSETVSSTPEWGC